MAVQFALPSHEAGKYGEIERIYESATSRVLLTAGNPEPAAIKGLMPGVSEPLRDHFEREPEILEALGHPQVPDVVEDRTGDENPYFVMSRDPAYAPLPRPYALDSAYVAQIMHSAMSPIERAHDLGIAVRDIKPDHFLVGGEPGTVQVVDFGAAAEISQDAGENRETGSIVGTWLYLAPEALRGAPPSVTGDIYSLGTVFYELLYGKPAHERPLRPEPKEGPSQEVLDMLAVEDGVVEDVITEEDSRAQETGLYRIRPEWADERIDFTPPPGRAVPQALIAVVERATQPDPANRYSTVAELREGIEVLLH